ncbi:MAG: TVP38/TMEM64 family protein [Vicinamibacterales bacterium]
MNTSRPLKFVTIAGGLAVAAFLLWQLPVAQWTIALADRLRSMGWAGIALFIAIYVVAEVALLPGSLFTLAAGFAYGPVGGLLVASPASVLAATVAFLLGRTVLRDWIRTRMHRYPKARALDTAIGRNSFKLILLLRLSPVIPFNVLNYALGLTEAKVGRYVVASFVGMLPGTWLYVYLGSLATTAAELTAAGQAESPQKLILTGVGLLSTVLVVVLVTRAAQRALDEQLNAPPA